eukprot:TRINITY_DN10792_c0_g1_i1.p1 TRINITY_DN10792_c0_g1~~TRINITY_DN10792_c0_g1_i1.p1  ORF type:complete len:241 (-),score=36.43 TRINITY_DN10792_c0_g1_i1:15-737(-)
MMGSETHLTAANLAKFNQVDRRQSYHLEIEKRVDKFLSTLDKNTKSQLSKTQLIKSHQKVEDWKKQNKKNNQTQVVPQKYLEQDLDPSLYNFNIKQTKSNNTNNPNFLSGQKFERDILPQCELAEEDTAKRQIEMTDWLTKRSRKLIEKEKLLNFIERSKHHHTLEELFEIYRSKKNTELTVDEIRDIFNTKENKDLSTTELLVLYRKEVPKATDSMNDDDSDPPASITSDPNKKNKVPK